MKFERRAAGPTDLIYTRRFDGFVVRNNCRLSGPWTERLCLLSTTSLFNFDVVLIVSEYSHGRCRFACVFVFLNNQETSTRKLTHSLPLLLTVTLDSFSQYEIHEYTLLRDAVPVSFIPLTLRLHLFPRRRKIPRIYAYTYAPRISLVKWPPLLRKVYIWSF